MIICNEKIVLSFKYSGVAVSVFKIVFNKIEFIEKVEAALPVHVIRSNATYLVWVDCSKVCSDTTELVDFIRKETGLRVTAGKVYGSAGKSFIRVNIATQNERVKDGINRFIEGVSKYINR